MKEAYRILPVYAGDVSGIASALYELGGMVVIHDPSGCNSTYNTHDENRWYDRESYIFLSGLVMRDAILGNDQKFIADICDAARQLDPAPRFIAICNSPVPFLNGTDFRGICRVVERELGIPAFYIRSNGMYDYTRGASLAFLAYARKMLPRPAAGHAPRQEYLHDTRDVMAEVSRAADERAGQSPDSGIRVNILGVTPLSCGNRGTVSSLRRILTDDGFPVQSVWAMDSTPEEIDSAVSADVNLVISDTGMRVAEYFREVCGTPYVVGAPVSQEVWEGIRQALTEAAENRGRQAAQNDSTEAELPVDTQPLQAARRTLRSQDDAGRETSPARIDVYIGEAVLATSLAAADPNPAVVLCPFADSRPLLGENDLCFDGEEELGEALGGIHAKYPEADMSVRADPMYGTVLPEYCTLVPEPTLALSGRMYQAHFRNWFGWKKSLEML